jgi:hypothetical protein
MQNKAEELLKKKNKRAKFANEDTITAEYDNAYGVKVETDMGHVKANVGYIVFKDGDAYYNQGFDGTAFEKTTDISLNKYSITSLILPNISKTRVFTLLMIFQLNNIKSQLQTN